MMCFQVVPETPQKEHEIEVVGKLELTHFQPMFHFYTLRKHQNFNEYRSETSVANGLKLCWQNYWWKTRNMNE